ncbi:MAG: hypothetical protein KAS32_26630 [Candidatus Peribacteraceae bacterium]|nr:hypothetical protein [Candidatus Peribacteraceae bacterium]
MRIRIEINDCSLELSDHDSAHNQMAFAGHDATVKRLTPLIIELVEQAIKLDEESRKNKTEEH